MYVKSIKVRYDTMGFYDIRFLLYDGISLLYTNPLNTTKQGGI